VHPHQCLTRRKLGDRAVSPAAGQLLTDHRRAVPDYILDWAPAPK